MRGNRLDSRFAVEVGSNWNRPWEESPNEEAHRCACPLPGRDAGRCRCGAGRTESGSVWLAKDRCESLRSDQQLHGLACLVPRSELEAPVEMQGDEFLLR